MRKFHLHLVSDATGETLLAVAKAALVQFEDAEPWQHRWSMVRTAALMGRVVEGIAANPGLVMFTLVDNGLRELLQEECRRLRVPCIPVLGTPIAALATFLGAKSRGEPGRQYAMDGEYFARIDAMHFCMSHDDGQSLHTLAEAEVILVGVSRTSKTPTCIYLGNRGIKAANIPIVPGIPLPAELAGATSAMIVGLITSPERLVQIRRNRLLALNQSDESAYADLDAVRDEVTEARKVMTRHGWPIIDVTRRSIEETATTIIAMVTERREAAGG